MDGIIFKVFGAIYKLVGILIFTGTIATALGDLQTKAFHSKQVGLVSMLSINRQLIGKR
jgi:hypothetical protein